MSATRTVTFIRDPNTPDEKTFTYTIPKQAFIYLNTLEEYRQYADAAFTVPYEPEGEMPDEVTVYIRRAEDGSGTFTLEDMARANTIDAIFGQYASANVKVTIYSLDEPGAVLLTEDRVAVKQDGNVVAYSFTERADGSSESSAYSLDGVFYQFNEDIYVFGFIEDGVFEEDYLPFLTTILVYYFDEKERLVSGETAEGIRTLAAHADISDWPGGYYYWGLTEGVVLHEYTLDARNGLIQRIEAYLLTEDGTNRLILSMEITYGQLDDFETPEFVAICRDMSDTRTITLIRDPGAPEESEFSFTIPKNTLFYLAAMEEYAFYSDAEFTDEIDINNNPSDELTVYIRRAG
jgi:hypothetical protein